MFHSRMTLWMRGVSVGSIAALTACLGGCVVESTELGPDADEMTTEAESQLDETLSDPATTTPGQPSPEEDPDPDPWYVIATESSDPVDPHALTPRVTTAPPGSHKP